MRAQHQQAEQVLDAERARMHHLAEQTVVGERRHWEHATFAQHEQYQQAYTMAATEIQELQRELHQQRIYFEQKRS